MLSKLENKIKKHFSAASSIYQIIYFLQWVINMLKSNRDSP